MQRTVEEVLVPHVGRDQADYIARMMEYTCVGGKLIRGLSVVEIARILTGSQDTPDGELLSSARRLGWCTELLQAYFLVIDDILDGSALRRGKPCWHLVEGVGPTNAINDGILLKSLVLTALKRWFSGSPQYVRMVELFHECALMTELGQMVDTASQGGQSLPRFSMEYFLRIARNKTSYYTYVLPLECGLLAAGQWGRPDVEMSELREACFMLGEYDQAQNDMLDFANDATLTGKEGTDIQEGKCTWLVATALERAPPLQRATLLEGYGKKTPACVASVRRLYLELGIPALYLAYEAEVTAKGEALRERVGQRAPEVAAALRLLWDKTRRMGALLEKHPLFRPPSVREAPPGAHAATAIVHPMPSGSAAGRLVSKPAMRKALYPIEFVYPMQWHCAPPPRADLNEGSSSSSSICMRLVRPRGASAHSTAISNGSCAGSRTSLEEPLNGCAVRGAIRCPLPARYVSCRSLVRRIRPDNPCKSAAPSTRSPQRNQR